MSIFQSLWDALGMGMPMNESDYAEMTEEEVMDAADWQNQSPYPSERATASNVVGMPGRSKGKTEVLVIEPRSFEEIPPVVTALKQRRAVILNLSLMDADTAQRCVDFVAGGAFAVDGHQQRIGETIFLFTPSSVQISHYSPTELEPFQYPVAAYSHIPPTPAPTPVQPSWSIRMVQ